MRTIALFVSSLALALPLGAQVSPDYVYSTPNLSVAPNETFTIDVTLDWSTGDAIRGWQLSVCHDDTALQLVGAAPSPFVMTVQNGNPPGFWSLEIRDGGFETSAVFLGAPLLSIPPSVETIVEATYTVLLPGGFSTIIPPCGTLPPFFLPSSVVTDTGAEVVEATTLAGTIGVLETPPFIRGDTNEDGLVNIADTIFLLEGLFLGGPLSACSPVNDANGDTEVDLADAIRIATYTFGAGAPLPAPSPRCGLLPGITLIDCPAFAGCP